MFNKRVIFFLLVPFVIVGTLLVSLYLSLPVITPFLAHKVLAKNGLELIDMKLGLPTYDELLGQKFHVESLALRLKNETEISLADIQLRVSTSSVKPSKIDISSVHINPAELKNNKQPVKAINLMSWLPDTFIKDLPSIRLHVNSLKINHLAIGFDDVDLQLSSHKITAKVSLSSKKVLSVTPLASPLLNSHMSLDIGSNNHMDIQFLNKHKTPVLEAKLDIARAGDSLQGSIFLKHNVEKFSVPVVDDKYLDVSNSELIVTTKFSLPAIQILKLDKLRDFSSQSIIQENAEISVRGEFARARLISDVLVETVLDKGQWKVSLPLNNKPLVELKGRGEELNNGDVSLFGNSMFVSNITKPIVMTGGFSNDSKVKFFSNFMMGEGSFNLQYLDGDRRLVDIDIADFEYSDSGGDVKTNFNIQTLINKDDLSKRLPLKALSFSTINMQASGQAIIKNERLTLHLASQEPIKFWDVRFNHYFAEKLSLTIPRQMLDVNLNTFDFSPLLFDIHIAKLASGDRVLKKLALLSTVSFKDDLLRFNTTSKAMNAHVSGREYPVPLFILEGEAALSRDTLNKVSVRLENSCNDPLLSAIWRVGKRSNTGELDLMWQHQFSAKKTFRQWLTSSLVPFDFTEGEFSGKLLIKLENDNVRLQDSQISLKNIEGIHQFGVFKGLRLQLNSEAKKLMSESFAAKQQSLSFDVPLIKINAAIEQLDVGIMLDNIELQSTLFNRQGDWYLKQLLAKANIFSGWADIHDEEIKLSETMRFDVRIHQLSLNEIIKTQQVRDLNVTGKVSGVLPLEYVDGEIHVLDGNVYSLTGGRIDYQTPLSEQGDLNEQLKLTLDVLKNFNYTALNSEVAYNDKRLFVKSSIFGKTAEIDDGKMIEFNLNTDIDFNGTIQAIRLQSGLESQLDKFISAKVAPSGHEYKCQ